MAEKVNTSIRTYTRGEIVPFEEDIYHEFKGHRTIAFENRMPKRNDWEHGNYGECTNTRQQWSKYLCGMLNSGMGGVLYGGIFDNGEANGFMMSEYQKLHVRLQLNDVFGRFTPPVPEELWKVEFIPQLEPDQDEYVEDSTLITSHLWNLPHKMSTSFRCWCDNDAAASHSLGIILPFYIIEVTIAKQEGTVYCAEDGAIYVRKHGMTEQLSSEENKTDIICVRCNKEGHIARECKQPPTFACYHCNKVGHGVKDCPEVENTDRCYHCGQAGHHAKDRVCPGDGDIGTPSNSNTNAYCHWCEVRGQHYTMHCPQRLDELA